jgi:ElaB/YqjD/DUF883 family membrane-anchored ribosome-binding protein
MTAANIADVERRLAALEKRLNKAAGRTSSNISSGMSQATDRMSQATDRIGEVVASALADVADRFRGGGRTVGAEVSHLGHEAARVGNDALRRLSDEVEHRPLMLLAIAAGVGFLAGIAGRRH